MAQKLKREMGTGIDLRVRISEWKSSNRKISSSKLLHSIKTLCLNWEHSPIE